MRSSLEYRYVLSNLLKLPTVEDNSDSILLSDSVHYCKFYDYLCRLTSRDSGKLCSCGADYYSIDWSTLYPSIFAILFSSITWCPRIFWNILALKVTIMLGWSSRSLSRVINHELYVVHIVKRKCGIPRGDHICDQPWRVGVEHKSRKLMNPFYSE